MICSIWLFKKFVCYRKIFEIKMLFSKNRKWNFNFRLHFKYFVCCKRTKKLKPCNLTQSCLTNLSSPSIMIHWRKTSIAARNCTRNVWQLILTFLWLDFLSQNVFFFHLIAWFSQCFPTFCCCRIKPLEKIPKIYLAQTLANLTNQKDI